MRLFKRLVNSASHLHQKQQELAEAHSGLCKTLLEVIHHCDVSTGKSGKAQLSTLPLLNTHTHTEHSQTHEPSTSNCQTLVRDQSGLQPIRFPSRGRAGHHLADAHTMGPSGEACPAQLTISIPADLEPSPPPRIPTTKKTIPIHTSTIPSNQPQLFHYDENIPLEECQPVRC